MISRLVINVLTLLSACITLTILTVMAETKTNYPYADIEVMKKESASDSDNNKNLVKQNNTSSVSSSNQKKRSIKMIVGGKSEDGIAKQMTLSVDE